MNKNKFAVTLLLLAVVIAPFLSQVSAIQIMDTTNFTTFTSSVTSAITQVSTYLSTSSSTVSVTFTRNTTTRTDSLVTSAVYTGQNVQAVTSTQVFSYTHTDTSVSSSISTANGDANTTFLGIMLIIIAIISLLGGGAVIAWVLKKPRT